MHEGLLEEVDIEEFAKAGKEVPPARRYRIRIDRERFTVTVPQMTGREILAVAGKAPEGHLLSQKFRSGAAEPVRPDQMVSFTAPGVERFMTMPRDTTEG